MVQEKQWNINAQPSKLEVMNLQNAINASEALAVLLLQRGINNFEAARTFFNPSLDQLHDPFLMSGMDLAVKRITEAINSGQNILVYGDYDVDGTSSVAMMYSFLQAHCERVTYYIPDRYSEGYGISFKGIDYASDNDVSLIIALDCGIKAVAQVKYASEKNIDFIICDHHLPGDETPQAYAILNPLRTDCSYPYKSLSGCGIGFKLIQALCKAWALQASEAYQFLDYVAIAAACDIVPMTGENRVLTHFGMKLMQEALRPGLHLLLENGGFIVNNRLKRSLSVSDLVFVIGPRINAAGRMEHGDQAVELLIAKTREQAEIPAGKVIQNNHDRRQVDLQILDEALDMIRMNSPAEAKSTVLFAEHWHKGVVGIVASRVQDHFYRPTVIMTQSNGKASGSARSVRGFDVHGAIERCADILVNFGGHPAAAGLTLELEKVDEFRTRFERIVAESIEPAQLVPCIDIDMEIGFDQVTHRFFEAMSRMAPFGPQNMRPVFVSHRIFDTGRSRCVGDGTHLKLEVYQEGRKQQPMKGIAFGLGEKLERMQRGESFSLVYSLEINDFNGYSNLELVVKDIRFSA